MLPDSCFVSLYLALWCFIHMSRHTFATLALTKGVPIESVSRMLGHTKITTTQIYAKITQEKLGRDMDMLSQKLDRLNVLSPSPEDCLTIGRHRYK